MSQSAMTFRRRASMHPIDDIQLTGEDLQEEGHTFYFVTILISTDVTDGIRKLCEKHDPCLTE